MSAVSSGESLNVKNETRAKKRRFASFFDHTLLSPTARRQDIVVLCGEAFAYGFFGVCVNSVWIPLVTKTLKKLASARENAGAPSIPIPVPIGAIGFPLGALATPVLVYEAKFAIAAGAKELDMPVNAGRLLAGEYEEILTQIKTVARVCAESRVVLKVIIETSYLNKDQITVATRLAAEGGANFIKTSTGFGSRGTTQKDVDLIKGALDAAGFDERVGIKASGGIKTLDVAKALILRGATRLGSSNSVAIVKENREMQKRDG